MDDFSHLLIWHGRRRCYARNPDCLNCEIGPSAQVMGNLSKMPVPAKACFEEKSDCLELIQRGNCGNFSLDQYLMSSKPLEGKIGVVFGVANKRSIAWAIAQAWAAAGAKLIFNYQGERLKENVEDLVSTFGSDVPLYSCDVTSDAEIAEFFKQVRQQTDRVDLMLHSVAFAPKEALEGDFLSTSREAFLLAHNISAYSLVGLAREAAPLMTNGGSIISMTYYGSTKVVPHYNVMGVAKASLEASTRYLAFDLGPKKIRVNCISAGPVADLRGPGDFRI